jgi:hypothetical protein
MSVTKCLWCGRNFTPRTTGGHAQRFCRLPCRRAYDAAGRRFVAEAIACGLLSLDQIRYGPAATRALLPTADSSAQISPPAGEPPPVAPQERPGEIIVRVTLDRMTSMQVRELRWGDPFHPADPEEMAAVVSGLLRQAVPAFMCVADRQAPDAAARGR